MEKKNNNPEFYAKTGKDWRKWLEKNCRSEKSVSLIIYHKKSDIPSVHYDESIEEAICFGWIDCKGSKRDAESFHLLFMPRKPRSNWSKPNRGRAEKMIKKGSMTPIGQAYIDQAKSAGTWDAMADAENSVIPDDLQQLFDRNQTALQYFQAFAPSSKRLILAWILSAKKPETRELRIMKTVALAEKNIKANH